MDYSKYYDLEKYLFEKVSEKFHKNKKLNAFDFFCILIWKANRSKTKQAERLLKISHKNGGLEDSNFDKICEHITEKIYNTPNKLEYLLKEWKFRLPTASAILTVLYPDEFTIYDSRVCQTLTEFKKLAEKSNITQLVNGYFAFIEKVKLTVPKKQLLEKRISTFGANHFVMI
ncbi:hypothetical protein HZB05_01255 [Candidatus Wolfebacteria bacterium]|nr:hypothetical protein [Candidatus Wolfebacteria bacterium]